MNDLVRADSLLPSLHRTLMDEKIWAVEPLGHTAYQLKNFVIRAPENPNDDTRYRACIRELWGRWAAGRDQQYSIAKAEAEVECLSAEQEDLERVAWWQRKPSPRRVAAERNRLQVEIDARRARVAQLKVELERITMREIEVLLIEFDFFAKQRPEGEGDRMAVEAKNWQDRAAVNPKLKGK